MGSKAEAGGSRGILTGTETGRTISFSKTRHNGNNSKISSNNKTSSSNNANNRKYSRTSKINGSRKTRNGLRGKRCPNGTLNSN